MQGLMQPWPLTVDRILDHAAERHGRREIVTRTIEGPIARTSYAEARLRAKQLSHALLELGIRPGDRVATLGWNTVRHFEVWYGVMGLGAVCHTLNPRLHPDQIAWIINHAGDRVLFVDATFAGLVAAIADRIPSVERVVVMSGADGLPSAAPAGALAYEELIDGRPADALWGGFEETTAAGLCYTSGTTGDPKGVLYSHRSNVLHTLICLQPDVMGLSTSDVVLPIVPMFHANGWGIPFSAAAAGAKLVLPGARMDGPAIHELLEGEGVTFSAAVPTVWRMLLDHLDATGARLTTLRRVIIGGAACAAPMIEAFRERHGVEVRHGWGMTESSPIGAVNTPTPETMQRSAEAQAAMRAKQGRPPFGVELMLADDEGRRVVEDGVGFGRLLMRGPTVARGYYRQDVGCTAGPGGWFDTGDIAAIDQDGFVCITDRSKDVIKSGGEWISSVQIETLAAGHPKVAIAAVVAIPHPKWDERPLLIVQLKEGATATPEDMLAFLEGRIARWWMPDEVAFVDAIPLGATGKIDKRAIRERLAEIRGGRR
jgi:fatty-acyl-CoA synthase